MLATDPQKLSMYKEESSFSRSLANKGQFNTFYDDDSYPHGVGGLAGGDEHGFLPHTIDKNQSPNGLAS